MENNDAEQYLDLIAENAQLKAEIQSLQSYDRSIRYFDRQILKACYDQAVGEQEYEPQFDQIINKIRMGIPSVESAESFKQIMIAERNVRLAEKQKAQIKKLNTQKDGIKQKLESLIKLINDLELAISEHNKKISESESIQIDLQSQIDSLRSSINEMNILSTNLGLEVQRLQASGVELKRNSDKAQKELFQYAKRGELDPTQVSSILQIVNNLKTVSTNSSTIQSD